jgi:hypothetical protein
MEKVGVRCSLVDKCPYETSTGMCADVVLCFAGFFVLPSGNFVISHDRLLEDSSLFVYHSFYSLLSVVRYISISVKYGSFHRPVSVI